MLKRIFKTMVFTTMFCSSGVLAGGEPICGRYACATFTVNIYGITEVVFNSKVSQELECWVKVQDAPVKFKLQSQSRIYSAGYGFSWIQYRWRCDLP